MFGGFELKECEIYFGDYRNDRCRSNFVFILAIAQEVHECKVVDDNELDFLEDLEGELRSIGGEILDDFEELEDKFLIIEDNDELELLNNVHENIYEILVNCWDAETLLDNLLEGLD